MSNLRDKNVFKPQQTLVIFVKIIQFGKTTKNLKRIGFVEMMDRQTMENSKYFFQCLSELSCCSAIVLWKVVCLQVVVSQASDGKNDNTVFDPKT